MAMASAAEAAAEEAVVAEVEVVEEGVIELVFGISCDERARMGVHGSGWVWANGTISIIPADLS